MSAILQRDLRSGQLSVKRTGTCYGYTWEIEWIEIGGNKPAFVADGSKLKGDNVTIGVHTIAEGGLVLAPIPSEFLRLPESKPQVNFAIYRLRILLLIYVSGLLTLSSNVENDF